MLKHPSYAMVNVSDMSRSVAFYRDLLGLPVRFESPGWTELDTGTTTVALHHVPPAEKAAEAACGPQAGTCSLGFSVDDLEKTHAELVRRGVKFVMPPTVREEEGIRLAVAVDPDGLALSFAEPLR